MAVAINAIDAAFRSILRDPMAEATVTHWEDGVHGLNSYHKRQGRALDVRTKAIARTEEKLGIEAEIKRRIGHLGFDVILEDLGGDEEHIHCELDSRADQ